MLPESGQPARRVGYVLKMYPRFSETFVVTELVQMQRLGIDLEVFSLRHATDGRFHASLSELRAPVTYLPYSSLRATELWDSLRRAGSQFGDMHRHLPELLASDVRDVHQALELARLVRLRGIGHLHAHFASVSADVARLAARIAGITYSITAHAKDIFHADVDAAAMRAKLRDASEVITISEFNLSFLRNRYGSDARRVRRVYNGLDLPAFGWSDPADRAPVIAAVGRLVEKKGFADLLRAAALLRRSNRDFRIDIVGSGDQEEELHTLRDELGLGDRVRFLGSLPQDQVISAVREAAVLAAPCVVGTDGNRDGLPTVLLEAMALGTPCVATPVTGIPEVLADGRTGLLVGEHEPEALAKALGRLLADTALRTRLSRSARALIEAEFDSSRQAAQVAKSFGLASRDLMHGSQERVSV
jgi:colanic acid/amylovoran biosynthesis glycosyltransferase